MNSIINFTLKNKLAVWLITIIVVVAGLYSGLKMKMESIPDISIPVLSVTTVYPGATPEQVDDQVSQPIEKAIRNLNSVKTVASTSYQNASSVQVEYEYGKNMDDAKKDIEDVLEALVLPDGVEDSTIDKMNINAFPILALSVANDKESLASLTNIVEDKIAPALEGLDGVSAVQVSGQQIDKVQLVYKEDKMKQLGLSQETVEGIIKGSDINVPLGLYTFKNKEKAVQVNGNITTIEDLKNMQIPVIPSSDSEAGQGAAQGPQGATGMSQAPAANQAGMAGIPTVKLSEIADIKEVGEAESISRTNGKEAIGISVVKSVDANTVDVANKVKDKMKDFEEDIEGLDVVTSFDQALPIEDSVKTMLSKALFGAGFAILIILLFLRDIRSTIISVVSIPLSLLIAVLLLKQMDITLNMMTLGAMTVAIGRVVDDSIVVIENIYRRMGNKNEKLTGGALIREATKEMFMPIMSSTIVTIAVFLPLGLVGGMVGELFLPFGLTMVFSLLASLFVAITIVPMLAHTMFKNGVKIKHEDHKPGKMAGGYKKILNWALNHKWITSGIAVLLLVGSLALIPLIGVSFMDMGEEKSMIVTFKPEPGVTMEEAEKITTDAEKYFLDRKDVEMVQMSLGGSNPMTPGNSTSAMFFINYDKDTKNFEKEKDEVIKGVQAKTDKGEWKSQDFGMTGTSNAIDMQVSGERMKDIEPVVKEVEDILKANKDIKKVDSSIAKTYDQYTFVADQEKLAKLGLTAGQISMALAPEREQPVLTTVEKDGEDLKVYVQKEKATYATLEDLQNKTITSPLGMTVKIKDVAKVEEATTSDTVNRRNGKIYVSVSGELKTDDVSAASQAIQKKIDKLDIPSKVDVSMGGVTADIQESFTQLGLAMLAAIAIVYLVLVITFGGGLAPFAILFSLPFTIIGALLALLISGETLSVSSMMGALMLIGIVVTNAIVLIDRVIHKEREGLSTREAILEAGVTRLRPILMTAIATIGALIPLALGLEGSGIISKSLGVTVIGGLISSTLLTLVIVPIAYEVTSKLTKKFTRKSSREMTKDM
ncbi:efflux RND transporter permease subunit [Bacillus massiliigorillae]|uniref:efflux RND transporter permease subunit n=1 Tax=Bacillus massiliigorillae TaxID=1243664 RepID=UPI0003A19333|nr:efflux RND transporter permease subunit [Bacillus massiliigorillae]